jgi:Tfp pilus assembly protein FimT
MSLMAYPRVSRAMIKSELRGGRTRLANMLATARAAATQNSRTATYVRFNGNTAVVTAKPRRNAGVGTEDTLGLAVDVSTMYYATLNSGGLTEVNYDPRGWGATVPTGGAWVKLTRGGYRDSVKVDQLGRVSK